MSKTSKFAFVTAVVAIGISSPVLAQSRDDGRNAYGLVGARNAYDRVVPQDSNSPTFTGGGSSGYNANLPKATD